MQRSVIVGIILIAVGAGAAMWITQKSSKSTLINPTKETNMVKISNFEFLPSKIKVKKGTTVTWTNEDTIRHDVKPDRETEEFKASELLGKGESYAVTFNTAGIYNYFCSPHSYMKGTVEVVE